MPHFQFRHPVYASILHHLEVIKLQSSLYLKMSPQQCNIPYSELWQMPLEVYRPVLYIFRKLPFLFPTYHFRDIRGQIAKIGI